VVASLMTAAGKPAMVRFSVKWRVWACPPRRSTAIKVCSSLIAEAASPAQWLDRGPNMMMAMPSRLTATPTQSVLVGLTLSTSISQMTATPM
jgi:hypothetical protein